MFTQDEESPNTSFLRYSRKYEDCVTESKTPDIFSPEEWDTDLDSEGKSMHITWIGA